VYNPDDFPAKKFNGKGRVSYQWLTKQKKIAGKGTDEREVASGDAATGRERTIIGKKLDKGKCQ